MKKVLLAAIAIIGFSLNVSAQQLEQDITYYKLLNKLWAMSGSFDKVAFHLDNKCVALSQTRETELKVIGKLYTEANEAYALLKNKEYDAQECSRLGEMMLGMENSLAVLKSEQWSTDPMWQYGYNLVKLRLSEIETIKETAPQLSQNKE